MKSAYDTRDYDNSFANGLWMSVKTSTILSFIISIFITLIHDKASFINWFGFFVGAFFGNTVISGFFTFTFIIFICYPMVYILRLFGLLNEINLSLVGGFIVFLILYFFPTKRFIPLYYIIIFWSMACSYSFVCGYFRKVGLPTIKSKSSSITTRKNSVGKPTLQQ